MTPLHQEIRQVSQAFSILFLLIIISLSPPALSQHVTGNVEYNLIASPTIDHIGLQLNAYEVVPNKHNLVYVMPYVMPNKNRFRMEFERQCRESIDESERSFKLEVEIWSDIMRHQMADALNHEHEREHSASSSDVPTETYSASRVLLHPFKYMKFKVGASDTKFGSHWIGTIPDIPEIVEDGTIRLEVLPSTTSVQLNRPVFRFRATCSQVTELLEELHQPFLGLAAWIITDQASVEIDFVSIQLKQLLSTESVRDLFRLEESTGNVRLTSKSSSNGFAIGIDAIKIGSTRRGGQLTTTDTRRRWVNGNAIYASIVKGLTQLDTEIVRTRDGGQDGDKVAERILDLILSSASQVHVRFEQLDSGQTRITDGQFEAILTRDQIDILVDSHGVSEFAVEDESYDGTENNSSDRARWKTSLRDDSNMKFRKEGDDWIPTTADLHVVNESRLRNLAEAKYREAVFGAYVRTAVSMPISENDVSKRERQVSTLLRSVTRLENELEKRLKEMRPPFSMWIDHNTRIGSYGRVPDEILADYCGDGDGCILQLRMKNWNDDAKRDESRADSALYTFSYRQFSSNDNFFNWTHMRSNWSGHQYGRDGDRHVAKLPGIKDALIASEFVVKNRGPACLLTDKDYDKGHPSVDSKAGVFLVSSTRSYNHPDKKCGLTVRD